MGEENKRVAKELRTFILKEQVKDTGNKERAARVKYYNQREML